MGKEKYWYPIKPTREPPDKAMAICSKLNQTLMNPLLSFVHPKKINDSNTKDGSS